MELDLEFIDIKERARKPKATIQRSGKLGFNAEAIEVMSLKVDDMFKIAINKAKGEENNLYLMRCLPEETNIEASKCIRASKAGDYFYLNLTAYFDDVKLDYETNLYIYNIYKQSYQGRDIFHLKRRIDKPRAPYNKNQKPTDENDEVK